MSDVSIYIDGSYFIFYRFFAILKWWSFANDEAMVAEPIDILEFVEKFKNTFAQKIKEIPKKCGIDEKSTEVSMYVGRDCKQSDIWRMEIFKEYKGHRNNADLKVGPFFKLVYKERLFEQAGIKEIYYHPRLEADDCIAIYVKRRMINIAAESSIVIITSDHDYLQLISPKVNIVNLQFKKLADSKNGSYDPKRNLFIKIIMGDKSDNIPAIFPKCGNITANKCYENEDFYIKKCTSDSKRLFMRNNLIINFDNIPTDFMTELIDKYND